MNIICIILCIITILIIVVISKVFTFDDKFFSLWKVKIYDGTNIRHLIIQPFNWIISNDIQTGEIFVFGSSTYKCKTGYMPMYVFSDKPDSYVVKCWHGTYANLISTFTGLNYTTVNMKVPPDDGSTYCVLNAINDLLDMGILKNN